MFFIDCQGEKQLLEPRPKPIRARYTVCLLPRGFWGKQATREMGLGYDPSLLC